MNARAKSRTLTTWGRALALLAVCATSGLAQEEEPPLERVWIPRKAFTKILARHPGGVLLTEVELDALVKRAEAMRKAGRVPVALDAPSLATIEGLSYTGRLQGETVTFEAIARVAVQGSRTGLRLPLRGIGLTGIWVEGKPARVLVGDRGPVVLLPASSGPVVREVRWRFALRVKAPDKRAETGAGQVGFSIPPAASGSLRLLLPGEAEPLDLPHRVGTHWVETSKGGTLLRVAFGGGTGGAERLLNLGWRPRRSLDGATPYVSARDETLCTLKRGVTSLRAQLTLSVFRAPRTRFRFELPPGFVVRSLTSPQGQPSYLQRGDQVEVVWPTARQGQLTIQVLAERPSADQEQDQTLTLRPLRLLDVDRSSGVLALAAGQDTVVRFPDAAKGLERADLSDFAAAQTLQASDASLVRVYLHVNGRGSLNVLHRRLAPRIALGIQAVIKVEARELQALAFYRYSVEAGAVYAVRAQLPPGFSLEDILVRDQTGQEPDFRLSERVGENGAIELTVELEHGLRAPSELLLTLQCEREIPKGVAGSALEIPRFMGSPHTELRGLFGFASDPTFRLSGRELHGLLAIPASELPRAGLEAEGLVLGYRVEGKDYRGKLAVTRRETRLSVEQTEHHTLGERLLTSEFNLDLDVSGAPVQELDLWLPSDVGELATIEGRGVLRERERVETAGGRERWRIAFAKPWSGKRSLRVDFQTRLEAPTGEGADATSQVVVPQVALAKAFRQRGALAVFSSGEAELSAEPTGLRPLEVTEAPSLGPAASALDTKRPLFAYRWVRADHGLILRVSRPGQTEVLSAVAEHLHLSTSASSDGTARHVAVFSVKNLDNQFFGLVLPEGAELWSVAVNGQGVKPAARDGILLIPIPSAGGGSGRDATLIQATYTQTSEGWGLLGSADLQAPSLTFGASKTDTVPILKTTWALSLPEDTRVLEVAGNLQSEAQLLAVQPLLLRGWSAWRHDSWPWLVLAFGIPGLLIVATGRGRAFLFGAAQGTYRVGGACRSTAVEFPWAQLKKPVLVAAVLVALVGLAAWGFSSLSSAGRKSVQSKTAKTGGRWVYTGGNYSLPLEEEGRAGPGAFAPANEKNNGLLPGTSDEVRSKLVAEAGVNRALVELEKRSEESKKKPGKRKKYKGRRRGGRKDQAQAPPSPARKPAGAIEPAPPMDGMTQIDPPSLQLASRGDDDDDDGEAPATGRGGRFADRDAMKESGGGGLSFQEPMDAPADDSMPEEKWASENNKKVDELSTADAYGVGGGAAGAYGQRWGKGSLKSEPDITAALNIQAGKIETTGTAGARISELGSGGQVGLRSLVLELRSVGLSGAFSRSGGGAKLHLSLASERLFLVLGGLCALFGFLGAVLAPATRRLSGLALVMIGLALTTAFPLVWNGALSAALANALTLGLLSAAPVLILGSLTRGWEARPFSRLLSALRAQPTQG